MNAAMEFGIVDQLVPIRPKEFEWVTGFLRSVSGIELRPGKEALVMGRLDRRLRHHGLRTYAEYFRMLGPDADLEETRLVIDLLTTNETYFFREPKHFETLRERAASYGSDGHIVRVWSAASSSGEEAYSIAMVLHSILADRWEVVGTDLSRRMVEQARRGLYPIEAAEYIPEHHRNRYCLRGRDDYDGLFTVRPELRARVSFSTANLTRTLPDLGEPFDIVFLRNVLIYFAQETKVEVVSRLLRMIRPGGLLLVGHAETLTGLKIRGIKSLQPSMYLVNER